MKKIIVLSSIVISFCFVPRETQSQNFQIGSGTDVNGTTEASPVNIYYRRSVTRFIYTASELQNAGMNAGCQISQMGWSVTSAPVYDIPDYTVKFKHTSDTLPSNLNSTTGWTTVIDSFLYSPDSLATWDMLNLNSIFTWNGNDNIAVEVCWSQVQPGFDASGQCLVYFAEDGFAYNRTDAAGNSCGDQANSTRNFKPQVQFNAICTKSSNNTGVTAITQPTGAFCTGVQNVEVNIRNFGQNQINSVDIEWTVNGVAQPTVNYNNLLDTLGGTNPSSVAVSLGSYNFPSGNTTIKAWTSNPNGVQDTVNSNDTVTTTVTPSTSNPNQFEVNALGNDSFQIVIDPADSNNSWVYAVSPVNNLNPSFSLSGSPVIDFVIPEKGRSFNVYVAEVCPGGSDTSQFLGPVNVQADFDFPNTAYVFTHAGSEGNTGPSQTDLNQAYSGTNLDGDVTSQNGIQLWSPPYDGNYNISAYGAGGGDAVLRGPGPGNTTVLFPGGAGALMEGTFYLTTNDTLRILVGQKGDSELTGCGGGGSFVALANDSPLVVAGGGGGGVLDSSLVNHNGIITNTGPQGGAGDMDAGGGGGFSGDGTPTFGPPSPGSAFLNGGEGGEGSVYFIESSITIFGGFGGGAAYFIGGGMGGQQIEPIPAFGGPLPVNMPHFGGAGGGYSGGTALGINSGPYGGGSFNSGSDQNNFEGYNRRNGVVVVNFEPSMQNDIAVTSVDSPGIYCPGMHDVVVTVQNLGNNQINAFDVEWSIDGISQTTASFNLTLDTLGGAGSSNAQVNLGSFNFGSAAYTISANTAIPNGQPDSQTNNDTASIIIQSSIDAPTNITASQITGNSAQFSWTPANASNSWYYSIVPQGNNPDSGITVNTPSVTVSGLDQLSSYDFYVREVCSGGGDTSAWSDSVTINTGFFCAPNARCFSTGGAEGSSGPTQAQINSAYAGTNLSNKVLSANGIQLWNVPANGKWRITTIGAAGGTVPRNEPGKGALMEGTFQLIQGQELGIITGQKGESSTANFDGGGGGGGSYVWSSDDTTSQPLIVAGGGAGGGNSTSGSTQTKHGDTLTAGGANGGNEAGGINGQGGAAGGTGSWSGGGGAGWSSNGLDDGNYGKGGFHPAQGGEGGPSSGSSRNAGGFGGGGSDGYDGGGGGGGYSGGRGGGFSGHSQRNGGGGGSYNTGTNQNNQRAFNSFDGFVSIEPVCVQPDSLLASNISPSNATISWSEPIDSNDVELVWGSVGFNPRTSGTTITNPSNPISLSGLTPGKNYDVYLRTDCQNSEYSGWLKTTFSTPFICSPGDYCFQTAGALNDSGPTQTMLDTFYTGTTLENAVTSNSGVQQWDVLAAGTWRISARGASAGVIPRNSNGLGVLMEGTFDLDHNQPLSIIVGQQGESDTITMGGGGGGASFVWETGTTSKPLLTAGGGGGGGNSISPAAGNNIHADTANNGQANGEGEPGGTGGNGGGSGTSSVRDGGGGGGWITDGGDGTGFLGTYGLGGKSALNGGIGGDTNSLNLLRGGFGGGGSDGNGGGGGGGGYSGGRGGENYFVQRADAGGGGSINDGSDQNNVPQANDGPGVVILSPICVSPVSLTASNTTNNSADLNWVEISDATQWEVSYSTVAGDPDNGTIISGINTANETLSGLNPGTTYFVYARSVCSATENSPWSQPDSFITQACAPANITFNKVPASCGLNNGEAAATVTGGTPPYTYAWNNTATSATISGLAPNTNYILSVTDSLNCTTIDTVQVSDAGTPSVLLTATGTISCAGGSGGAISASVSAGSEPYTYQWSTADTGNFVTGLFAGMYRVTVTDSMGCSVEDSLELTQPNPITIGATINQNVSCNSGNDGEANISATGGTGSYSYAWSSSATGASQNNLTAGNYTITVSDANNCEDTIQISITEPSALSLSATIDQNVSCNGGNDGEANISATGGTGTYSYAWSNSATGASQNNLTAGNYTITVSDANNCEDTIQISITEPAALSVSATIDQNVSCNGGNDGEATISATDGTGTYSYAWSNSATGASQNNLAAGNYTITISDANSCEDTVQISIIEPSALSVSANINQNVSCNGGNDGEATISVTGGTGMYSYAWSNSASGASQNNLTAGNYTITVSDANSCEETIQISISEPASMVLTMNNNTNVSCYGQANGSITTVVTGGQTPYHYQWSNGMNTASAFSLDTGSYSVTVTDANGCLVAGTQTISGPAAQLSVSMQVTNDVSCSGGSDGEVSAGAAGGTPAYSYTWSNAGTGSTQNGLLAGVYFVTVEDSNNCSTVGAVTVSEPSPVQAVIMNTQNESCAGSADGTATATGLGGTAPYSYAWPNSNSTAQSTGLAPGSYEVTVTDFNGCTSTSTAQINGFDTLELNVNQLRNVSCAGGATGEVSLNVTGGKSPYAFNWSNGTANNTAVNLSAGIYGATVTDANGCTDTVHVQISQPGVLQAQLHTTHISCNGAADGQLAVSTTGGKGNYTYQWSNQQNGDSIGGLTAGNYLVTVSDSAGCSTILSTVVNEPELLTSDVVELSGVLCTGGFDGKAFAQATGGTSPYGYVWGNGETDSTADSLAAGVNRVTMTDFNGCETVDSVLISEPQPLSLFIDGIKNVTCFGYRNGEAEVEALGGTAPYRYEWSTASRSKIPRNLRSGFNVVTVTDINGCSATDSVELGTPEQIDTSLTTHYPELIINLRSAQYRWLNCETNQIVPNETGRRFTPPKNGSYRCVIFAKGCADTTRCFDVFNVSAGDVSGNETSFEVYPNPNRGAFTVRLTGTTGKPVTIEVTDMSGRRVHTRNIGRVAGEELIPLNLNIASGVYFVKIIAGERREVKRIVVQ